MATIEPRDGKFSVRWRDPDGTSRRRSVPTKAIAKELIRQIDAAHALGRKWEPEAVGHEPTLDDMSGAYIRDRRRVVRPRTLESVSVSMSLFIAWAHTHTGRARLSPSLLTKATLSDWWDHCRTTRGNSEATANMRARHVEAFWEWASDHDEYEAHTPRPRRIDLPAIVPEAVTAPTWEVMDAAIGHARGWYRKLLILARCTGLRRNQLMRLDWSDVDMDAGTLRVRPELGKSRQERTGRTIPLAPVLLREMAGWGMREGRIIGTDSKAPDWGALKRVWRLAGNPASASGRPLHAIRKGFVSGLRSLGADPDAIEYLVGHARGISGVYTDPAALPLADAVALVPEIGTGAARVRSVSEARSGRAKR